jgi:hypothetical protein
MSLSIKSTPPYYKHWFSCFKKTYDKTPENIVKISAKVARIYTFFLTPEAHDTKSGFWQQMKESISLYPSPVMCPSPELLAVFKRILEGKIKTALMLEGDRDVKLSVDYGPDPGVLQDALIESMPRETFFDCAQLFPRKSFTRICICDGKIVVILRTFL